MSERFANYPSLMGRVALVTGGASGIGADIVRALHGNGARVAFVDVAEEEGRALERDCKGSLFVTCDLLDIDALRRAIARVGETLGPIGVLVNNAANDDRKPIDDIDVDYWDWSQNVNVRHQFFAAQAVWPMMRTLGGGSIINFSSIAWRFGADAMSAYATGKSAVIGLTKALARGFGADNIRVNAIEPGAVMTGKQRKLWYPKQEDIDRVVERQMIRKTLTGDDIARTVLFLAADDSRMITKQTFIVDAGPFVSALMFRFGLNPYGLTYHLGLQGKGTPRENPKATGLRGFIAIAKELKAQVLEIFDPWLAGMGDDDIKTLRGELQSLGMTPVVSAGLNMMGPVESALRSARLLDAKVIRLGLSPVLEGSRNAWGQKWFELQAAIRDGLAKYAPMAADQGVSLAIENHQDFTSLELVDYCETGGPAVGITFDTGNTFPVGEAPLDFTRRIAPYVRHVHLKDYRVQFTDEGYRLVRCAIGDGAVPFVGIREILARHHAAMNAVLEPGALEARHIRFLKPEWWRGYAPMDAKNFAAALAAARVNRLAGDADYRTPWERGADGEIEAYELAMIRRSAANMRAIGIMQ